MIDKTRLITTVLESAAHLSKGHYLDIRSYKRNRYVLIVKNAEEEFTILVDGYCKERIRIAPGKLEKTLSRIFRREFPRSNKIRLYRMGEFDEDTCKTLKRKVI
jgi:hypothetical protein